MITIYENFSPNIEGTEHFYFEDITTYLDYISSNITSFLSITEDNYRLNNEFLVIENNNYTFNDLANLTYIVWNYENQYKFYHIKDFTIQSDKVFFNLQEDYFAEFISKANITSLFVNQTNLLLNPSAEAYFKDFNIEKYTLPKDYKYSDLREGATGLFGLNDVYCFFLVELQWQASLFNKPTGLQIICVSGDEFISKDCPVEYITFYVQQLQHFTAGSPAGNCNFLKMWIIPKIVIENGDIISTQAINFGVNAQTTALTGYFLKSYKQFKYDINVFSRYDSNDLLASNNIYVGTYTHKVKFNKCLDNIDANPYFIFQFGVNDIGIKLYINGGVEDFTNDFMSLLTSSNSEYTQLGSISKVLSGALSIGTTIANISSGNVVGGITSGINTLNLADSFLSKRNSNVSFGGDIITNMKISETTQNSKGFIFYYYAEASQGYPYYSYVVNYGLEYNQFCYEGIEGFFSCQPILDYTTKIYLRGIVEIENIPITYSELIKERFRNGIYIRKLANE